MTEDTRTGERRTSPFALLLITATLIASVVGIVLQAGVVNPGVEGTGQAVRELQCAQAESTAVAFRKPLEDETRQHFVLRMLAQRRVLLIARDNACPTQPGTLPFDQQVLRALRELNAILGIAPKQQRGRGGGPRAAAAEGGAGVRYGLASAPPSSVGSDGDSEAVDPGSGPDPSPGKGGSRDPKGPGKGGGGGGPAPADPSPATPPVVQPVSPEPEPEAEPARGVLTPTLEGIEKGAGEVVGGVGGTVEQVGCKLKGTC